MILQARSLPGGRRLTPQRRVVYDALAGSHAHPDAERLIALVHQREPNVSIATVYNTLRVLSDAGWIRELRGLGPKTRYDANVGEHDHFTCRSCGALDDIPPQLDPAHRLRGRGLRGYLVEDVAVHARGICGRCRASGPGAATPRGRTHPHRPPAPRASMTSGGHPAPWL